MRPIRFKPWGRYFAWAWVVQVAAMLCSATAQDISEFEFQRIFVPENRSADWPRGNFDYAPQIELKEFESLVKDYQQRLKPLYQIVAVQSITYRCKLEGDQLVGTAEFQIAPNGESPGTGRIPLAATNLSYRLSPEETGRMVLGLSEGERNIYLTGQPNSIAVDWAKLPSRFQPNDLRFDLALANASRVDFYLELPNETQVELVGGIELGKEFGPNSDSTIWHLSPDWRGNLGFQIRTDIAVDRNLSSLAKHQSVVQIDRNSGIIESTIQLQNSSASETITITFPRELVVTKVAVNGEVLAEPKFDEDSEEYRTLAVLPSVSTSDKLQIEIAAMFPLSISTYTNTHLPLPQVISHRIESHQVSVELQETLHLGHYDIQGTQFIDFFPATSFEGERIRFRMFDPTSRISLQIHEDQRQLDWKLVHLISVNDLVVQNESKVLISSIDASQGYIDIPVLDDWQILRVTKGPEKSPVRWEETRHGGDRVLRVSEASEPMLLTIVSRRLRDNDFSNLGLDQFRPFPIPLDGTVKEWISVEAEPGFRLQFDPTGLASQKDAASIDDIGSALLPEAWQNPLYEISKPSDLSHLVSVTRNRATYSASISLRTLLDESQYREFATINLTGDGLSPDILYVWSTQKWPSQTSWKTSDLSEVAWTLVSTSSDSRRRDPYYIYQLLPPTDQSFPIKLQAVFPPVQNQAYETPTLLSVPSAEPQQGELSIVSPTDCLIETQGAMLRKKYLTDDRVSNSTRVFNYEYRPNDLRRKITGEEPLIRCNWKGIVLPDLFATSATHTVFVANSGGTRSHSTWNIVTRNQAIAEFQLPERAELKLVQWNQQFFSRYTVQDGLVQIEMPSAPEGGQLTLVYSRPPPAFPFLYQVEQDFAEARFPTSVETTSFALGNQLHRLKCPVQDVASWNEFAWDMRLKLWSGLIETSTDRSVSTNSTLIASEGPNQAPDSEFLQASFVVINHQDLCRLSVACLLIGFILPMLFWQQWKNIAVFYFLAVAMISAWMPNVVAPLTTALFVGPLFSQVLNALVRSKPNTELVRDSSTITAMASIAIFVSLSLALPQPPAVIAADSPREHAIYPVLIPIDQERQPTGQAYLPEPLYELLIKDSKPTAKVPGYILEDVHYSFTSSDDLGSEMSLGITTLITLTTTVADQQVVLPIDVQIAEQLETALLDGSILPGPLDPDTDEISVLIREPGSHQIELRSQLTPRRIDGTRSAIDIQNIFASNATVTFANASTQKIPKIESKGIVVSAERVSSGQSIDLGPITEFSLEWESPALRSDFEFQEFGLLEYAMDEVQVRWRLKISDRKPSATKIVLETDPRLQLVSQPNAPQVSDFTPFVESMSHRTYSVEIGDQDEIELTFRLADSQLTGRIQFPSFRVLNGTLKKRWVAVAAIRQLQVQSRAQSRVSVLTQEDFLREWRTPIENLRFAVASLESSPLIWEIATRPITTRGAVRFAHKLLLDKDGYDFNINAQIETYSGTQKQFVVELPPNCLVDTVQLFSDGTSENINWHLDRTSGELSVLLLNPALGLQDLVIYGRQNQGFEDDRFSLPPIHIRNMATQGIRVEITRDESLIVSTMSDGNRITVQDEIAEPQDPNSFFVGKWEILDPELGSEWLVQQNKILATGDILSVASIKNGGWQIDCYGNLEIRSGSVDSFEFLVPKEITFSSFSSENYEFSKKSIPDPNSYILHVKPLQPILTGITFQWSGQLKVQPGQPVTFSPIRLVGQPHVRQFVAIPKQIEDREVLWISRELRLSSTPATWVNPYVPATHHLLYARSPDYACQISLREKQAGDPTIELSESRVAVDRQGNLLGLSKFAVFPQGNQVFEIATHADIQVFAASVDGSFVSTLRNTGKHALGVPLKSATLPQTVEVLYASKPDKALDQNIIEVPLVRSVIPSNQQRLLGVKFPSSLAIDFKDELAESEWFRHRVTSAFHLKNGSRDSLAGPNSDELIRWDRNRMIQSLYELNAFQGYLRSQGESAQSIHREVFEVLGEGANQIETWPVSATQFNTLANLDREIQEELDSPMVFSRLGESEENLVLEKDPSPPNHILQPLIMTVVCIAALTILLLRVRAVESVGLAARSWAIRNPQIVGVFIGLFWWCCLPPNFIGLLLIAGVFWATLPQLSSKS